MPTSKSDCEIVMARPHSAWQHLTWVCNTLAQASSGAPTSADGAEAMGGGGTQTGPTMAQMARAMSDSFLLTDKRFLEAAGKHSYHDGSTALVVALGRDGDKGGGEEDEGEQEWVVVANAGDSRCVLGIVRQVGLSHTRSLSLPPLPLSLGAAVNRTLHAQPQRGRARARHKRTGGAGGGERECVCYTLTVSPSPSESTDTARVLCAAASSRHLPPFPRVSSHITT
jgi:hypothetical protein